jgi:drug/metabolite transporter (DMT)-like permease
MKGFEQKNEDKKNKAGLLFVLASAILFSLGGVLIKTITWSSITINGVRNLFAFIVMLLYIKKIHHKIVINHVVIGGAICNLLMNLTFVIATKLTSAANAIVLQFTAPIFLLLYIWIFFKKKPDQKAVIACALVFLGIMCFFFDKLSPGGQLGNLLALLSGALYAFIFMLKKIENTDFESSILLSQLASFLIFIPWYFKETDFAPVNFILVTILGVVQMGVAYVCLAKGLDRVKPVTAALTSTIEPILNPIWVAVFYGEMISPIAMAGAAIVIISSTIYNVISAIE